MLLVSESGAKKKIRQRGNFSFWTFDVGVNGDHFDYTHAQQHFPWIHRVSKNKSAQQTFPSN
jgi:hypothetical protein